jgi:hypothetical protein
MVRSPAVVGRPRRTAALPWRLLLACACGTTTVSCSRSGVAALLVDFRSNDIRGRVPRQAEADRGQTGAILRPLVAGG